MDDDWDLHAVVRGCTAAATTKTSTTTTATTTNSPANTYGNQDCFFNYPPGFSTTQETGHLSSVSYPFNDVINGGGLEDLYKPYFPQNNSIPSFSSSSNTTTLPTYQPPLLIHHEHDYIGIDTTVRNSIAVNPINPRSKRRKNLQKKVCQVPVEGLNSDIWAWRKYGQKPIKGSPYPRGYYRCSSSKGCVARKQVERNRSDPAMFILTFTGEHNHPAPTHRNSLAGSTRTKPSTSQSGDSTKLAGVNCLSTSSPATSMEEEHGNQSMKMEISGEELMAEEEEEEEDLYGFSSDAAAADDYFLGFDGFAGTESEDSFSDNFPSSF